MNRDDINEYVEYIATLTGLCMLRGALYSIGTMFVLALPALVTGVLFGELYSMIRILISISSLAFAIGAVDELGDR
jgi:hypothetical protein